MKETNQEESQYSYKIKKDIYADARNWYGACHRFSHGTNWKKAMPSGVASKIADKTEKEAFKFLIPFLKQKYIKEKDALDSYRIFLNEEFENKFQKSCDKIVQVMGRPLYRNDFTVYITTLPRGPYNKETGSLWICLNWADPIRCFLHELCHFQFIHYWAQNKKSKVNKLSREEFEFLKESLTIILDKDFELIIQSPDRGYAIHQEFRKELERYWAKTRDFEKLVDFGVETVPEYLAKTLK